MSETKRKAISQPVKLMLYSRAKGLCAFPDCRKDVVIDATTESPAKQIGKIAHIIAHSDVGPRADPEFPQERRDEYENLILLCANCHDIVD
ncbi:MAG: HNH endonuclease, partial [Magnetococcales bacterium]|nr:HNH endonuclease [Magnetococcales bacterium]